MKGLDISGSAWGAGSTGRRLQDADGVTVSLQDGFRADSPGMVSKLAA